MGGRVWLDADDGVPIEAGLGYVEPVPVKTVILSNRTKSGFGRKGCEVVELQIHRSLEEGYNYQGRE